MACKRLALLIACPYGGLLGPDNDVELMAGVLEKYGFESTKCCGPNATRKGILDAWQHLNSELSADDVAVIYYSGHGGIVESSRDTHDQEKEKGDEGEGEGELGEPLRSQFLVPMDFNLTTENDFRGILDIEISYMLRDTTNKTENVTVILDCCHAARMARDPSHNNKAWPRNLPEIKHHGVLLSHVNKLRSEGQFKGHNFIEGNPHAVRIAAAATAETAWGYENWQRKPIGILTEALAEALDKAVGQKLSWRTILMGVCEFVKREFPQQHPRAEGPDTRLLFSKEHMASGALMIQIRRGYGIIQGGTVAGIHEGNIYDVMPFGFEVVETAERAAEVKVKYVNGFQALAEVTSGRIPIEGGIAFLRQEAVSRVQVSFPDDLFPDDLPALEARLEQSRFLKRCTLDTQNPMVNIKREGECLLVCKGDMVLSSHPFTDATMHTAMDAVVRDGERLARAHHVLSLESGKEDEKLNHATEIEFGLVDDARCMKKIKQDGMATVIEDQRAYIKIHNGGYSTIFVSVFDVNVAGKVTLVSKGSSKGIELRSNDAYVLGKEQFGRLRGLKLSWPQGVSKEVQIEETLVFVISSEEVSLQHLADPSRNIEARGRVSSLEKITYHLVSGQARDMETEPEGRYIRYAVHHIPFSLHPERAQRFE